MIRLGKNLTERDTEQTEPQRKPYFELKDNELMITHDTEPRIHRVVFKSKKIEDKIAVKSSFFRKLKTGIGSWDQSAPLNFYKNESMSLGLSKNGKIIIYVKSDLSVFPKEFLRVLREHFNLTEHEIVALINQLEFVEMEIAHKINDPYANLKEARVDYDIEGLIKRLIAFTDNSNDSIELELKGDPETSGNLDYLLRDKLQAVLYFAELTKVLAKLNKVHKDIQNSLAFIENGLKFLLDDFISNNLIVREESEEEVD